MGRGRAGSFWGCPALTRRRIVLRTMAHLSRDETAPKMGHPSVVRRSDVGHPSWHEAVAEGKIAPREWTISNIVCLYTFASQPV